MGYVTKHTLIHDDETYRDDPDYHELEIGKISGYHNPFEDECKWYDCDADMCDYSKKHPKVTFTVEGVGEDYDDIWIAYYVNGKMARYTAQITFPEFHPADLVDLWLR